MRVRSIAILDALEVPDITDETMLELVKWVFQTSGSNVVTVRHGSHIHVKGKGLEIELYDTMPIWMVYSEGNYFAFTEDEFHKHYEDADKHKIEARVTVQTQKEFTDGAAGTVFQALVNSGLTRDQALDGLVEIQSTGILFVDKSTIPASMGEISKRCMRCDPLVHGKYAHNYHETSEHDQWLKYEMSKETNPDA